MSQILEILKGDFRLQYAKMIKKNIVRKILRENRQYFDAFENYDKTREWLIRRRRIDIIVKDTSFLPN